MSEQLNILDAIDRAKARRDLGIERVARKSGDEWQAMALDRLRRYISLEPLPFLAEDFQEWAMRETAPPMRSPLRAPHDARAFGAVMQTAARKGLIRKVGYRAAKSSNMSPKVLWQRSY